jgi:hypothetical protein
MDLHPEKKTWAHNKHEGLGLPSMGAKLKQYGDATKHDRTDKTKECHSRLLAIDSEFWTSNRVFSVQKRQSTLVAQHCFPSSFNPGTALEGSATDESTTVAGSGTSEPFGTGVTGLASSTVTSFLHRPSRSFTVMHRLMFHQQCQNTMWISTPLKKYESQFG